MDYNDNEETINNVVKTAPLGTWQGDTRTCEKGQVIYGCAVINRPPNMNDRPDNNREASKGKGQGQPSLGDTVSTATSDSTNVIATNTPTTTTWGKLSPTKQKNVSIGAKMLSSAESTGGTSMLVNQNIKEPSANQMITWKDVSPPKSPAESDDGQSPGTGLSNGKCECPPNNEGSPCKSRCECNCSSHCISHKRSLQSALSQSNGSDNENSSPKGEKGFNTSPEDLCNNEYFYDEDFSVQFDTNLRESSVTPSESEPSTTTAAGLEFPHMVTGSYLSFNNMRGSSNLSINNMQGSSVLRTEDRGVQQYNDSEFSGSRNSTMEISSSERDMMCSSDLIDLSDGPLFTPTPTHNLSTDSLDRGNREVQQSANSGLDMLGSNVSGEANLGVNCCPRKEEYFLSFDGSQSRVSSSETDCSLTSHDSGQGHWNQSEGSSSRDSLPGQAAAHVCEHHNLSGEEGQEESSDSFHFCYAGSKLSPLHRQNNQYVGRENLSGRVVKKLLPLHESVESSEDDSGEACKTSPTLTAGSGKAVSLSPFNSPQKKPFSKPLTDSITKAKDANAKAKQQKSENLFLVGVGKSSDFLMKGSCKSLPARNLVSWKQLKGLKNLGKTETPKCVSMPELSTTTSWQSISSMKSRKVSEICDSFHNKTHSATLLDFYQRMKSQSNPVSPETMNNLEQFLMPKAFTAQNLRQGEMSDSSTSSVECTQCQCHQRAPPLSHSVTKAYTNKRIFDWLKMECSTSSRPTSLGCQTNRLHECASKETLISPQTVTMWCGTKNFGAQFPPLTKDCGIQTSLYVDALKGGCKTISPCVSKRDQEIQTSNLTTTSDESEILSLLSETYNDFEFLRSNEETAKEFQKQLQADRILSSKINRSKSVDECGKFNSSAGYSHGSDMFNANDVPEARSSRSRHIGRSKSAGRLSSKSESPFRRMGFSSHYNPQSLPDLAFLSVPSSISKDESRESLFDPMKLDMPVPVFITPKTELEHFDIYQRKSHCCSNHRQSHVGENKSKSAIQRMAKETESASSSSGFSTSSTSSGIDPGYCTCENRLSNSSSPHFDLERLIFYPPHTELTQPNKCCGPKKRAHSVPKCLSEYTNTPINIKLDRYAYEVHPHSTAQAPPAKKRLNQKRFLGSKSPTSSATDPENGNEDLYAVEEEQTPIQSPEKQSCCHNNNCHQGDHCHSNLIHEQLQRKPLERYTYDSSDFYRAEQQFMNVEPTYFREFSTDSASSSGSFATSNDKKPLKSCLRKNRALRSRSMSDPFTLNLEEVKMREKVKNRHSYACDEVYIVSDEFGQLMMYGADESAEPVMFYLDKDGECHMTEGGKQLDMIQGQDISESDSSSERDGSSKRKSVSFASEVSFQSISPTASTKKKLEENVTKEDVKDETSQEHGSAQQITAVAMETEIDTESKEEEKLQAIDDQSKPSEPSISMETEIDDAKPEPIKIKGYLHEVTVAVELIEAHYAQSKDPFDKLTLGDTTETPKIGDLVLDKLCPALSNTLCYGMRRHLVGFQMFGRVQVTIWKIVEASVETVPQTRTISDLVHQVKQKAYLVTHQQKFNAFVFGLLNLRLLDFWMSYLRRKDDLVSKFYEADSFLQINDAEVKRCYDMMLTSLQPLSVFPFQLSLSFLKERLEMVDTKKKLQDVSRMEPTNVSTATPPTELNISGKTSSERGDTAATGEVTSVLELTASKALNWITSATFPKKKSGTHDVTPTKSKSMSFPTSNPMTGSDDMKGSMSMSQSFSENLFRLVAGVKSSSPSKTSVHRKKASVYKDAKTSFIDTDRIISPLDSLRVSATSENSSSFFSESSEINNSSHASKIDSVRNNPTPLISPSLTTSASNLVTKLFSLGSSLGQKSAYRKGATDYSFEQERLADSEASEGHAPQSDVGDQAEEQLVSAKNKTSSPIKVDTRAVQRPPVDTSGVKRRPAESLKDQASKGSSKRVSFDIVNLFDKLLLPSPKSEKPGGSKPASRWSWGVGSARQSSDEDLLVQSPDRTRPGSFDAMLDIADKKGCPAPPKPPRVLSQPSDEVLDLLPKELVTPTEHTKLSPLSPLGDRNNVSYDINSNTQEM